MHTGGDRRQCKRGLTRQPAVHVDRRSSRLGFNQQPTGCNVRPHTLPLSADRDDKEGGESDDTNDS